MFSVPNAISFNQRNRYPLNRLWRGCSLSIHFLKGVDEIELQQPRKGKDLLN